MTAQTGPGEDESQASHKKRFFESRPVGPTQPVLKAQKAGAQQKKERVHANPLSLRSALKKYLPDCRPRRPVDGGFQGFPGL